MADEDEIPPIYSVPTTETFETYQPYRPQTVVPQTPVRKTIPVKKPPKQKSTARPRPRDFKDEWKPYVRVKYVNIEQRSAFPPLPLPPLKDYPRKNVSPSYEHLQILHKLRERTVVPQLDFVNVLDHEYTAIDKLHDLRGPPPYYKRKRLPNAADVGFPTATEEEIRQKQIEINQETEWEEQSPRLVLLATSDHLGTIVNDDELRTEPSERHKAWNGGGLQGMPFAGPQLIHAIQRNARYFGKPTPGAILPTVNPYSMLAPPLDATPSPSQHWRPRPFHDRLPGLSYALAVPTIHGFTEPIVASIALYLLPVGGALPGQGYGKISEEYWFPAGHWTPDKLQAETVPGWLPAGNATRKAIFSFRETDSQHGRDNYYLVVKLYSLLNIANLSTDKVFAKFGTQFLKPMSYAVVKMFPLEASMDWPETTTVSSSFQPLSESTQDFVDTITTIAANAEFGAPIDSPSTEKKKRNRFFRTPMSRKASQKKNVPKLAASSSEDQDTVFVSVEVSSLPVDFLQVLLAPKEAQENGTRLLADVSGDYAVALDPNEPDRILPINTTKRRSDLLRLPPSSARATYSSSAVYREVMYLPPRLPKHYNMDPVSNEQTVNFLYLYPRDLSISDGSSPTSSSALRFRVMKVTGTKEDSVQTRPKQQRMIYSKSPWSGDSLVDIQYLYLGNLKDLGAGDSIPVDAEVKIRLPQVLDSSYKLEIALVKLIEGSDELELEVVAGTNVPLMSISRDRDRKIPSVIPNGLHRFKLGDTRLHLETRLLSPFHVSDPATVSALYDCSPDTITGGSPSAIQCHSRALLSCALNSLANARSDVKGIQSVDDFVRFIADIFLQSSSTLSVEEASSCFASICKLINKHLLDMTDEPYLAESVQRIEDEEDEDVDGLADTFREGADTGGPVLSVRKSRQSMARARQSLKDVHSVPRTDLVRVPYGVSKSDKMKLEAELRSTAVDTSFYFDDDETIATSMSYRTPRGESDQLQKRQIDALTVRDEDSDAIEESPRTPRYNKNAREGTELMLERVRTAAKVILAPCVVPGLSDALTGQCTSTRNSGLGGSSKLAFAGSYSYDLKLMADEDEAVHEGILWSPNSDIEEEESKEDTGRSGPMRTIQREPNDGPLLELSVRRLNSMSDRVEPGTFLYESILTFWLRSWLEHVENIRQTGENGPSHVHTFPVPSRIDVDSNSPTIFSLYVNQEPILNLCLKSLVLRSSHEAAPTKLKETRVMLDQQHLDLLEPFVEVLARGLLGRAIYTLSSKGDMDGALLRSLEATDSVLNFLIGLSALLHADHLSHIIEKFFRSLRRCEVEFSQAGTAEKIKWNENLLEKILIARHARLRGIEILASMPSFVHLNFPSRYAGRGGGHSTARSQWLMQYRSHPDRKVEQKVFTDGIERLPSSGWLVDLVSRESLSICSLCCETIVAEAITHTDSKNQNQTSVADSGIDRDGILRLQGVALHSITTFYELVIRRHVMDIRFQSESIRSRVASMFVGPILEHSIGAVRWLARMDSTHRVRSTWLLSLMYVFQESPDDLLRDYIRSYCTGDDIRIHKFVRLLRLCSSTFQGFHESRNGTDSLELPNTDLSPWLLQESFNTICATANLVVEEAVAVMSIFPKEEKRLAQGIFDFFLHTLTTPQSPVTSLRALAGALDALEKFDIELTLEIIGATFENWARVILSLMNNTSLSVRSIAVDFLVTLFGSIFARFGSVSSIFLKFATVLPEVVAREIALKVVDGFAKGFSDLMQVLWPLRRAFSDLESIDPADDDRVDPFLVPAITRFCRASQAIIDGVYIELYLQKDVKILGSEFRIDRRPVEVLNADEESLFEAASFFDSETGLMQKLRWLDSLHRLHIEKKQYIEAAESCFEMASSIVEALPLLKFLWRPSLFSLWTDSNRSLWLGTVGADLGIVERGHSQVMDFANRFLEPIDLRGIRLGSKSGKLRDLTVSEMCQILNQVTLQGMTSFGKEDGFDELCHYRIETLLQQLMITMSEMSKEAARSFGRQRGRMASLLSQRKLLEKENAIRSSMSRISAFLAEVSQRILQNLQDDGKPGAENVYRVPTFSRMFFVGLYLSGKRVALVDDKGSIPSLLEHDSLVVCRIAVPDSKGRFDPLELARPYIDVLKDKLKQQLEVVSHADFDKTAISTSKTYLHVISLEPGKSSPGIRRGGPPIVSRHFYHRKADHSVSEPSLLEVTLAKPAPCLLSRQRAVMTSQIETKKAP